MARTSYISMRLYPLCTRPTRMVLLFLLCYLSWPTPRHWQWGSVKNETLWQKRWFQFSHCELFICNIPAAPAYGVYISQLIRYSRPCDSHYDVLDRGFLVVKLKSSLRKFYGRHHDLVNLCGISVRNDHGYVTLVVFTVRPFPHIYDLSPGL